MGAFMTRGAHKRGTMRRVKTLVPIVLWLGATAVLAQEAGDAALKRQLSASEEMSSAQDFVKKMGDTEARVNKLLDAATKKKDVIKINCVRDKLTFVKGHIAVGNQHMGQLSGAVAKGDTAAAEHEYTAVNIVYQKVIVLGTEAENCIGEDVSYVGATKVIIDIDPSVPTDDPTQPPIPLPDPSRPPEATPIS